MLKFDIIILKTKQNILRFFSENDKKTEALNEIQPM